MSGPGPLPVAPPTARELRQAVRDELRRVLLQAERDELRRVLLQANVPDALIVQLLRALDRLDAAENETEPE